MGFSRIRPSVPRRGVSANTVAKAACTTITAPACAKNRRAPGMLPSSTPQKTLQRALTRSTAVRPLYSRSNFFVARGKLGNRLSSISLQKIFSGLSHPCKSAASCGEALASRDATPKLPLRYVHRNRLLKRRHRLYR